MKNARRLDRLTTRKTARQGVFRRLLKKKDWSYEREHRIIRELSKADQIEENIHLYRIPHEAVSAIIIGYAATDDLISKIKQATQSWPNANDVKIKRVTISANGNSLEYA